MLHSLLPLALVGLTTLSAPLAASGQVWVVDTAPGPGVDFTVLQDAVDAASDGDLVLIEGGQHGSVVVDGLSVSIHMHQGTLVDLVSDGPLITVRNLAAHQTVVLRNLNVLHVPTTSAQPTVLFEDNLGVVQFEDALVDLLGPGQGVLVRDSASVTLSGVGVQGGGSDAGVEPLALVEAQGSHLEFHGGFVSASAGVTTPPSPGMPAVRLRGAELVASASTLRAGNGGNTAFACQPLGDGGAGVVLQALGGVDSTAVVHGLAPQGGSGGFDLTGCGAQLGMAGPAFDVQSGQASFTPGTQRTHFWASPVLSGEPLVTNYGAISGDLVWLVLSTQAIPQLPVPALGASLLVSPDFIVTLGAVPLPPPLAVVLTAPPLPPGVDFVEFATQAVFLTGQGEVVLTGRRVTAIVAQ